MIPHTHTHLLGSAALDSAVIASSQEYEQQHSVQEADGFPHGGGEYMEDFPFSLGDLSIDSGDADFASAPPDTTHTALGVNTSDVGTLGEVPRDNLPIYTFGSGNFDKLIHEGAGTHPVTALADSGASVHIWRDGRAFESMRLGSDVTLATVGSQQRISGMGDVTLICPTVCGPPGPDGEITTAQRMLGSRVTIQPSLHLQAGGRRH